MTHADLRDFLATLEKNNQLCTYSELVRPEPDLPAAARAMSNITETGPALMFTKVDGYDPDRVKVVLNLVASWPNHALMLGLPPHTSIRDQFFELARRWDAFPAPVERATEAPWQENVITEDIDLFKLLPLFRINSWDAGTYLDKAVVVSRDITDPDHFGKQNVGIYRIQVKDKDRLAIQSAPSHDLAKHLRFAEERGQNLPIVIALGNEPVISMVASMPLAYDQSEYEMASAIQGAPYRIVKSPLTGCDVPWGSEVVLEGEIICREREIEGPFGEFTGHYSAARNQPVVRINRVWHRTDPIFESLYIGRPWTEMEFALALAYSVPLHRQLKDEFPEVDAVNAMISSGLVAIISLKPRYGGFAKAVGMRAMTVPHGLAYCKVVILVDETVDPFDLKQVMWAISVRFHPQRDLVVVPNASLLPLDPSSDDPGIMHKTIIDATMPVAPERAGHFKPDWIVEDPDTTEDWETIIKGLLK